MTPPQIKSTISELLRKPNLGLLIRPMLVLRNKDILILGHLSLHPKDKIIKRLNGIHLDQGFLEREWNSIVKTIFETLRYK